MAFAIRGSIVPLEKRTERNYFEGRVYFADDGRITAVTQEGEPPPKGMEKVEIVNLGKAFVFPGLIDLHSHVAYNALPLWTEPTANAPFKHHNDWTNEPSYESKVTWPSWAFLKAAPEPLLTYAQVQALVGGTTAIQGWPFLNRHPANQLVRHVDDQRFADEHGGKDNILTSVLTLRPVELKAKANQLANGLGFIYHVAEGQRGSVVEREFATLAEANCLRQRLIAIHCCALGEEQFKQWKQSAKLAKDRATGAIVWSPFSNLWLYGQTADVPSARKHGLNVCLGTDWGPSGTKNLLGELKVARLWADHASEQSDGWKKLDNFELLKMVTANPGDAVGRCWGKKVGRLVPGALGDVTVIKKTSSKQAPWDALVEAREEQVLLVLIDGTPRYGTKELMRKCGARRTTAVSVGSERRHVMLIDPKDKNLPPDQQASWTWAKVLELLEAVRDNPEKMLAAANREKRTTYIPSAVGPEEDPLILEPDMPGVIDMSRRRREKMDDIASLRHDRNWRATIKGRGFHDGLLDKLDGFYRTR